MKTIGRRGFARALGLGAGAAVLSPLVDRLVGEARGQPAIDKRFVVITQGNGFMRDHYRQTARSETDFDLNAIFAPLAPHRADLSIVSPLYNPFDRALHGNQWATLSVVPSDSSPDNHYRERPGGVSIDRWIARHIGADDRFASIAGGLSETQDGTKVLCVSADGANMPFPAIGSPVTAFRTYFGDSMTISEADAAALAARERSLLDFMRDDIARASSALAGSERAKLDQYLTSIRTLERQLGTPRVSCDPVAPSSDVDNANLSPEVVRAHIDVTAQALLCGLTKVAHVSILGFEGPHNHYGWLGDTKGHHTCHHDSEFDVLANIDRFVLGEIAHLWQTLRDTREGDGSFADRTVLIYVNTCGGMHHYGQDLHPVVMLGSAGGALRTGRYLEFAERERCISDLFLTVARAIGIELDCFGDPDHCAGPIDALLA